MGSRMARARGRRCIMSLSTQIYMLPASWLPALTKGDLRTLTSNDLQRLLDFTLWMRKQLPTVQKIHVVRDGRENRIPVYKTAFHDAQRFQPHCVDCHEYQFLMERGAA